MRGPEQKPPRFNRYHAYLIVGALLISPVIALYRLQRSCGHALYGWGAFHRCTGSEAWDWLLSTGGSWEVWVRVLFVLAIFAALFHAASK
jgi:hypothetical protein